MYYTHEELLKSAARQSALYTGKALSAFSEDQQKQEILRSKNLSAPAKIVPFASEKNGATPVAKLG